MGCYADVSGEELLTLWRILASVGWESQIVPQLVSCNGHDPKYVGTSFFNRHCNPRGFWPAQLSLSILSRKVFTECRCQWHVKPPTWRTSDLERSTLRHKVSPASETTQANPSSGRWNVLNHWSSRLGV